MIQNALFHPAVAQWFNNNFSEPTAPQVQAWPLIKAGRTS
jgi:ATP-dependent Lhr-like helicase